MIKERINNLNKKEIVNLNNLIGGDYIFSTIDECNFSTDTAVTIEGYNITKNAFALLPNCGSYDIELEYICNGNTNEFFWLQKQLPSGAWGNPETNIEYQEGSVPNAINSLPMINQSKNYNLTYNGLLRIVHNFQSYNNGKDLKDGTVISSNRDCSIGIQFGCVDE